MQITERRRQGRARDAIADRMDAFDTEQVADGVDHVDLPLEDIIVERRIGDALVGRLPADHEQADALVDAPFDEAFLGTEVENVEAVDPGGKDHDGRVENFVRGRGVLDQLVERRLFDDLARRGREITPHLEHARLGLRHLAGGDVLEHVGEALEQVLAARLQRPLENLRVGQREV